MSIEIKTTEIPLESLVAQAQKGDTNAFRGLFDGLSDRLFRYAASHVTDRDEAFDVVQETFIELWNGLPRFEWRSPEAFYGFIFIILKRKLARYYKNTARALPFDDLKLDYEIESEDYRHLLKHIHMLPEHYRDVITLRYWSELKFAEIASALNIKETTAKVWHHRALARLKKHIKEKDYLYA